MPYTQHIIVEGRHLGTTERPPALVMGQFQRPISYAFFCPCCAEIWARCPVEGQERWMVQTIPCRKHSTSKYVVPGSLTLPWDGEFTTALPKDALSWELERHLDHAERMELV
jgi:hypothetical protein